MLLGCGLQNDGTRCSKTMDFRVLSGLNGKLSPVCKLRLICSGISPTIPGRAAWKHVINVTCCCGFLCFCVNSS